MGVCIAAISLMASIFGGLLVECEQFTDKGGWSVDSQFIDEMGSSYLLAHGIGKPVADAATSIQVDTAGKYDVYVRTKNWTAHWSSHPAGVFSLAVDGRDLSAELGTAGKGAWVWQHAGAVELEAGVHELRLRDRTGFDGRCDAVFLSMDGTQPPQALRWTASETPDETVAADLVVCGAGVAGICAAISAARLGVKVALVTDRPVLGGANSSEVRVHLGGRLNIGQYPRLGDVVAEIGPAKGGNAGPAERYEDARKLDAVKAEKNIRLFKGVRIVAAERENGAIKAAVGRGVIDGRRIRFDAPLFADCTGDGALGALAGADFRIGREGRDETGEKLAPEKGDAMTMGASVQWNARTETGAVFPVQPWMLKFSEESCSYLKHGDWDWETGMARDQLLNFEYVRDYGMLAVYSNWAFVKNLSRRKSEWSDLALNWVAHVAGKRETRRLLGDHILSGNDIFENKPMDDGTCLATWSVDLHYPMPENVKHFPDDPFRSICRHDLHSGCAVPYRCLYSRNVGNLFMAGRNISVTHVALGTVRVMRTTGMMGEVIGMAAAVCRRRGCAPRAVYAKHLDELKGLMFTGVGLGKAQPPQNYNLGGMKKGAAEKAAFTVDTDIPAGNAIIEKVDNRTVCLRQDLRDSGLWFYWAFRVKGAAGRTVRFEFTDKRWGGPVGVRGPVVSTDGGKTFSYPLDGKSRTNGFTYTFGPEENDVRFYECHPYVRADWDRFVAKHVGAIGKRFVVETLCRSRKGADVPCARFGCIGAEPRHRIFMSARHHCSESMANWVLEGVAEAFLADDSLGRWLRENVELMMVPFVDYDGVQAGDQGKVRKPHDHNRDYSEFIYPETKAITQWIAAHARGKLDMFIDVHCPWIRGKYNEFVYTPWKDPKILPDVAGEKRFSELLEKLQSGEMRYRACDDLPFGKEWNKGVNYEQGWASTIWACHRVEGLKIARSFEIPFANANGAVVEPKKCRGLGGDIASVFRAFLEGGRAEYRCISGVYPHLVMYNDEGECGTGAVVPWAGDLWVTTYGPHCPVGSSDKLYRIKPDLTREIHPSSVGGTHANRMIHRESGQLLIGPYVIDAKGQVRTVSPGRMPGRLTGAARHLTDPANKVYVATMETGLYELDMRTLEAKTLIRENGKNDSEIRAYLQRSGMTWPLGWDSAPVTTAPGYHAKGLANGFGRVFISNNGEDSAEARRNPFVPSGVLACWSRPGCNWTTIRRCQFTEVTTRDGIYGNEHPSSNPVWAMGWDAKSVVLAVTTNGVQWSYYRLPKASHCYDGAHGWNTEWPRIRDVGFGDGSLLATMHGTFWRFPKGFSPANPSGIRPISTYLKVVGDFCRWGERIVFGCDDQTKDEFLGVRGLKKDAPRCNRSQSNLWFVNPGELGDFGPPSGEGCVWLDEKVRAGDVSDPYLHAGYASMRFSFLRADGTSVRHELLREGDWVRVKCLEDAENATACFRYGPAECAVPELDGKVRYVFVKDDGGRTWRFPNVNGDTNVVCREIATERDLLYAGGVWYEVPAENAGGFAALRPIALADASVESLYGEKGLMYLNGEAKVIDDLWKNGTAPAAYWLWERERTAPAAAVK